MFLFVALITEEMKMRIKSCKEKSRRDEIFIEFLEHPIVKAPAGRYIICGKCVVPLELLICVNLGSYKYFALSELDSDGKD
jgi:hypothetical protein